MKIMMRAVAACALGGLMCADAHAFRSMGKLGDAAMFIANGWAIAMAASEPNFDGIIQYGLSTGGALLTTDLISNYVIHERRPNKNDTRSFPSGHATGSFSPAMYIHRRYGLKQAIVPYSLAIFTGFTRVYTKNHYVHDVLGGAVVSGLFTWMAVSRLDKTGTSCLELTPTLGADGGGMRFRVTF